MLNVKFIAQVDDTKCSGCKLCEKVCLTDTIKVVNKVAIVDDNCLGCTRCVDVCWYDQALTMVPRSQARYVGTDVNEVDADLVRDLCAQAHRLPGELVCVCANTSAGEIAAAIVKGARSFKDLSFATGVLQGCQEFCVPPIQRMLKAKGVDVTQAGGFLKYDQAMSMWDIPKAAQERIEYYFQDDLALATKSREGVE
ncbi:MAG: (2Fe-2S)-binding protein [Candidatus Binatia bacterium]